MVKSKPLVAGPNASSGKTPDRSAKGKRPIRKRSVLKPTARGRQVTRLFDLLRALERTRYGLTVNELIEQLLPECSERTVYRDLRDLMSAGFPIETDGSRYFVRGSHLASEPLQSSQVLALLLAEDFFSPLRSSPIYNELSELRHSLRARLTPVGRKWLDTVRATMMATQHVPTLSLSADGLEEIQEALITDQLLRIEYAAPEKPVQPRIVEPHLLWCRRDSPYLVAYCHQAEAFRLFALQRIRSARRLEETFERRDDFDPEEYVARGFGAYHGEPHDIVIRFSSEVAHLAHERTWHPSQRITKHDGGVDLEMTAEGLPEIAAWIASFGGKVQAIEPPELLTRVREIHEAGLAAQRRQSSREPSRATDSSSETPRTTAQQAAQQQLTSDDTEGA